MFLSTQDDAKKDEIAGNATTKKGDSDSEEDEQEVQQKEKGLSNKKKKVSNEYLNAVFYERTGICLFRCIFL